MKCQYRYYKQTNVNWEMYTLERRFLLYFWIEVGSFFNISDIKAYIDKANSPKQKYFYI